MEILQHLNHDPKPTEKINQQVTLHQPHLIRQPPQQQVNHETHRQKQIENHSQIRVKTTQNIVIHQRA